ncbi:alpha/beta hydrolase [Actinoplanes sp. KI2]|uniref:alpha/beta fold hydrolase n=1 Tax=Actinoplanes sp. KI2 TaxID=2983315 RepID=UPI0021D59A0B|nr:alpha/beta hydrolase [Actinoplanes sp. KI2]MCU7723108.1 alpha/beta hydrolase [Actinoplanes sp. KI2]
MIRPLIATTSRGPAGYLDTGSGPGEAALFIHGVGTGSSLWRGVIDLIGDERRCVAVDLPLHGRTPAASSYELGETADFVAAFCAALGLTGIDLVANDTGGAIAQIFAARHPELLRSFTLTNCDTIGNIPPKIFAPVVWLARARLLAPLQRAFLRDPRRARRLLYGPGVQRVEALPITLVKQWLAPLSGDRAREAERWMAAIRPRDLVAVEPKLAKLEVPTQLVWGTGDVFFRRSWAYRLKDSLPGAREVIEVPGARLFFPAERPADLAEPLLRFWKTL